jgi:PAS domain S-box-containing protein
VGDPQTSGSFSPRMVDSLVDAVVLVDDQARILYANPAVQRMLGWEVTSLFGVPFTTLLPERTRGASEALFHSLMDPDTRPISRAPMRTTVLAADGSEVPVDIATSLVDPGQGLRLLIAVLWDVSDRIDIQRYQRVSEELLAFLAGASGSQDEIIPQLLGVLCSSLDFEFATAWEWDAETELLHCGHAWRNNPSDFESLFNSSIGMNIKPGEGLPGLIVRSNEPLWYSKVSEIPTLKRHRAFVADGVQAAFIFPIRTRERLAGVIELLTRRPQRPDQPLFEAIADVGATLGDFIERLELDFERRQLLVQLERSHRRQNFLLSANRALAGAHGFHDAVRKLAEVAVPTLGDICLIDVLDSDGVLKRMAARHADPSFQALTDELGSHAPDLEGSHPAALAVRKGESQWSSDMGEQFMRSTTQNEDHYQLTRSLGFQSFVSVPLLTDDEAIGALTLVTAGSGRPIGREELLLAEELASQVAAVIKRAQAFDEQSTIARHLQSSLLPQRLDRIPGINVAVRYVTGDRGAEVGGDFYDVIPLPKSHVAFVIGDVEGHDMTAATVMGQLRSAFRAYLMLTRDPGTVLSLLAEFALRSESPRLATATLAVLDPTRGELQVASAGHPAPFVADDQTEATPIRLRSGPPLGVKRHKYTVEQITLRPGARIVLYTDGLIDVGRPEAEQQFSYLIHTMGNSVAGRCDELADAILAGQFGPEGNPDDIALLVVEWLGAPTVSSETAGT